MSKTFLLTKSCCQLLLTYTSRKCYLRSNYTVLFMNGSVRRHLPLLHSPRRPRVLGRCAYNHEQLEPRGR